MLLFKIGPLNFDFSALIAFLIGILFASIILAFFYAIMVLSSLKKSKYVLKNEIIVSDEEIKEIITNAYTAFDDKALRGANSIFKHTGVICKNLVMDISRKYYPKSKRPFAELTIDEILLLLHYVSLRMNEILDRPFLRKFKKIKLSTILSFSDVKKKIDDSELMKASKKYKVAKVFKTALGVLNIFNPVYWVRKIVVNTSLDIATKKLCKVLIGIVGEETYKIYSKKVFDDKPLIDTGIKELIASISTDLKDVKEEDIDDYLQTVSYLEDNKDEKK